MNRWPLELHPPACEQVGYILENALDGDAHGVRPYLFPGRRDLFITKAGAIHFRNPRPESERWVPQ